MLLNTDVPLWIDNQRGGSRLHYCVIVAKHNCVRKLRELRGRLSVIGLTVEQRPVHVCNKAVHTPTGRVLAFDCRQLVFIMQICVRSCAVTLRWLYGIANIWGPRREAASLFA